MNVVVEQTGLELNEGKRVKVTSNSLAEFNGGQHPQAGKTGIISELIGVTYKYPGSRARAMIKLDGGEGVAVVSLEYLEDVKFWPAKAPKE